MMGRVTSRARLRLLIFVGLFMLVATGCVQQPTYTQVAGRVVDGAGRPVTGAAVLLGKAAAVTDRYGQFSLSEVLSTTSEAVILMPDKEPYIVPVSLGENPQTVTLNYVGKGWRHVRGPRVDYVILLPNSADTDLGPRSGFTYLMGHMIEDEMRALTGVSDLRDAVDYLQPEALAVICNRLNANALVWVSEDLPGFVQIFNRADQTMSTLSYSSLSQALREFRVSGGAGLDDRNQMERDEASLAREVKSYIERQYEITYTGEEADRVRRVAASVTRLSERANLDFTFGILETSEEYNAFALPGGYIYITRALLDLLETESELAAVLAHESAHITHMHAVKTYRRQLAAAVAAIFLTVVTGEAESSMDIVGFIDNIVSQGYSKSQEYDADRTGLRYIVKAGYHPEGMEGLLEKLLALERKQTGGRRFYSRTHPPTESRIAQVRSIMKDVRYYEVISQYL